MDFSRLWVDKYRPTSFQDLTFNQDLNSKLQTLSQKDDYPHMCFYGPDGSGKKTRIMCFLSEVYGKGVYKISKENWSTKVNSVTVELPILSSKFHLDVTPSDAEHHDRTVLTTLIKESAGSSNLFAKSQKSHMTIIINEADRLTRDAQAGLRRTMEKYATKCRIIMCCEDIGGIIPAIRSRCLLVRNSAPSEDEIEKCMRDIMQRENVEDGVLDNDKIEHMKNNCGRNLRRALLRMQNAYVIASSGDIKDVLPEWQVAIKKLVAGMLKEQSAKQLKQLRVYDLLANCIPPDMIIKEIMVNMVQRLKCEEAKADIAHWAAHYENKLRKGDKAIIFIEAFMARVMLIIHLQKEKNS